MRTRQLEIFHAVYTKGSITEAAKVLNVSQPSVSKVLAHTEIQLGYLLFQRIKRRLVPTSEAHILFRHADKIHADLEDLKKISKNLLKHSPGLIRLASTPSIGLDFVPSLVSEFSKEHPEVRFEIHTLHLDQIEKRIKDTSIDLALAYNLFSSEDLKSTQLLEGNFVLLAPRDMKFNSKRLTCDDLVDLPFIEIEGPFQATLSDYFQENNFKPNFVTTTDTYQIAKSLVEKGMGITILDQVSAINQDSSNLSIWSLDTSLKFSLQMVYSDQRVQSLFLDNFENFLREYNYKL
jgi:DNA-binding transcriptional LysR family regulator|tara:strand:+ start:1548 stop:2423 length:876 start_codon:yes stop_codon:yes gene_type:complete